MGIPNNREGQDLCRFANGGKTFLQMIPIYPGVVRLIRSHQLRERMPPEGNRELQDAVVYQTAIGIIELIPIVGTFAGAVVAFQEWIKKKPRSRPINNDAAAIRPDGEGELQPLLQQTEEERGVLQQPDRNSVFKRVFLIYERMIEEKVEDIRKILKASESFNHIPVMKVEYGDALEQVDENNLFFRLYCHPGEVKPELWNNQKRLSSQCGRNCVAVSLNNRNIPGYYEDMLASNASGYLRGQQFIPVTIVLENSEDLGDVCREITGVFNKFIGRD